MYKESVIAWTIAILIFTTASTAQEATCDAETALLELNRIQFQALVSGRLDRIRVAKTGEHQYSALKPITDIGIPQIPVRVCWDLFDKYLTAHLAVFQAWANKHCRNFISCWCCSGGGFCVTFFVRPTRLCFPWVDPVFAAKLQVFEAESERKPDKA